MSITTDRVMFFYENAGWSYDPETQTPDEGHWETARHLAKAEEWAHENGIEFLWVPDEDGFAFGLRAMVWGCIAGPCRDHHFDNIETEASLWGIEFADGTSWVTDPYAIVVEAELASQIAYQRGAMRS